MSETATPSPYRTPPAIRPVVHASVRGPRWPAGVRFVFDTFRKLDRLDWTYPGCVPLATEGGQSAPFIFEGGWEGSKTRIVDDRVRELIRDYAARGTHVIAFDLEYWARDTRSSDDAAIERSNQWMRRLYDLCREADARVLVGSYTTTNREYWAAVNFRIGMDAFNQLAHGAATDLPLDPNWAVGLVARRDTQGTLALDPSLPAVVAYEEWKASDDRLGWGLNTRRARNDEYGAIDAADLVFADCYLMYNRAASGQGSEAGDIYFDRLYLQENIREAKRVASANGNKPVVVYVMPWLINCSPGEDTTISDRRWSAMLDVVAEEDGHLAIWSNEPWAAHAEYFERLFDMALERVARPLATRGASTQ